MDVRERLSHVLWIGGGPRVGKTTLSRVLAGKYDLKVYNADWHHVREHRTRPGGAPSNWEDLSMDERWLHPSPEQLADRDIASWTSRSRFVVEDVLALPRARVVVAEGPSLFPWWIAPLLSSPRQAIFLLPTPERRDAVLARRERNTPPAERWLATTSDPERSASNVRARDLLMGERIVASCEEVGLRWVRLDGSLDLDDSVALLEEHFRPHLPAVLNV